MLTLQEAMEAAAEFLARNSTGWDPSTMRLRHETARIAGERAVVPYNTIAFLDQGHERQQLLGNRPVVVDLVTGACRPMTLDEILDGLADPEEH